jgi:hypothetical protein
VSTDTGRVVSSTDTGARFGKSPVSNGAGDAESGTVLRRQSIDNFLGNADLVIVTS